MPNDTENGKSAIPAEYDGQAPGAAAGGAVRRCTGPRHQQQQQDVVDRHHEADEGAMIAERLPHQQRDEVAQKGPGDAREQPAETDDRAGEIRRGLFAGRVGNNVNHRPPRSPPKYRWELGIGSALAFGPWKLAVSLGTPPWMVNNRKEL
jgi:hypothetical protein